MADRRAPTPSAAAEIVAESEDQIEAFIEQSRQDLLKLVGYKLLQARTEVQSLALSNVMVDFPRKIGDQKLGVEKYSEKMGAAIMQKLKSAERRLEEVSARISPIELASKLHAKKTRFAVMCEKQIAAMKKVVASKDEKLKVGMASLDAMSPLSVLRRGYSITQREDGGIVSSAAQVSEGENVHIRVSDGKLNARILKPEKG